MGGGLGRVLPNHQLATDAAYRRIGKICDQLPQGVYGQGLPGVGEDHDLALHRVQTAIDRGCFATMIGKDGSVSG